MKNYQLSMNNEQRKVPGEKGKGNEVSNLNVLATRSEYGQKPCSSFLIPNSSFLLTLIFVVFSLFTVSCELFTGPKVDLFKKISDEVDWAKARKLTVRIEYPSTWGGSNPMQGTITPTKDIRKGYPFEIEFTPDQAWSFVEWRAYAAESISVETLGGDWRVNTNLLDDKERLDEAGLVEVPALAERGGAGSFKINTTENVTLVPWCKTEPYVIRTVPRNSPAALYARGTDIVIYFNAPIALAKDEPLPLLFTSEIIRITAGGINISGDNSSYNYPVYTANYDLGEYKITITASDAPADSLIEVTVGPGICNAAGSQMRREEVFSFSTSPGALGGSIDTWGAAYDEKAKTITVNWSTTTTTVDVVARYRIDHGGDNPLSADKVIGRVDQLDAEGVREGRSVRGIKEYEIFLDLYAEGVLSNADSLSFKIWNISGMNVRQNNTVLLDSGKLDQADFRSQLASPSAEVSNFVLTSDFELSDWEPVNLTNKNFYGNGYTVTINGMTAAADIGLFGVVSGGIVRDLTVLYETTDNEEKTVTITRSGETRFGGIAGTATGTTTNAARFENVLVKGAFSYTQSSVDTFYTGGIVGLLTNITTATRTIISNAYSSLDLSVDKSNMETKGSVYVGGVAGSMGNPGTGGTVTVEKASVVGDIIVGGNNAVNNESISDFVGLFTGGITGYIRGANKEKKAILNECNYRLGTISVTSGEGSIFTGGAVGLVDADINQYDYTVIPNAEIVSCSSMAGNYLINKKSSGFYFFAGGFIGFHNGGAIKRCYSENPININTTEDARIPVSAGGFAGSILSDVNNPIQYCYAKGNVSVFGYGSICIGGFTGSSGEEGIISYCYATGNVSGICLSTASKMGMSAGGFSGSITNVSNCYSTGDVFADTIQDANVGGFSGNLVGGASEKCFATGNVVAQKRNMGINLYVGGLFGLITEGSLEKCVALNISVTATGSHNPMFSENRVVGRVFGHIDGFNSDSYAYNGMRVYGDNTYGAAFPKLRGDPTGDNDPIVSDSGGRDGADTHLGLFHNPSFWQNTLDFGINFWDFSTVAGKGHPILRGEDGKPMAGQ